MGAQLRVNCLTLCNVLHGHHSHEDAGLFPAVDERRPDLADAMARLRAQHASMAALLADLRATLADPGLDAATLRKEVDRLTTEVETHLDYEEETLIPVLDAA